MISINNIHRNAFVITSDFLTILNMSAICQTRRHFFFTYSGKDYTCQHVTPTNHAYKPFESHRQHYISVNAVNNTDICSFSNNTVVGMPMPSTRMCARHFINEKKRIIFIDKNWYRAEASERNTVERAHRSQSHITNGCVIHIA